MNSETLSPFSINLISDYDDNFNDVKVYFDIDSCGGFASSLDVARIGLNWRSDCISLSNLRSSLHLPKIEVEWDDPESHRRHKVHRPIHQIPHLLFGNLEGDYRTEVYLIFPGLYSPRDKWVITRDEYTTWTDKILLPAIKEVYPISLNQHIPSSAAHIQLNATASSKENQVGGDSHKTSP
ncbi:hypothetical protein N7495_001931 [Penicillium taxi]|uniref:uncharacterized protein n=1 Tax=Penicillium taxi TaxID=168475 RepID=UPI0025452836|nr:uncharacterized protein N7495_001931 [Penicillium taxi]KAJ5909249.1 hypothetical protein N7495_001931 [Penicillium taxi]